VPRNGSGIYGPPAGTAAVPNTTIESADYNAVVADVAQALTDSVNVQGTAPFQANQPMGGNRLTGLGTGSAAADSATVGQIQADLVAHASAVGGTADTITAIFSPAFTAYTAKMRFRFTAGAANTITAPTINVDGLGAKTIKKLNGAALAANDIAGSGHICDCVYNGTDVILLNFAPVAVDREQTFTAKQTFSKPLIKTIETLTDAATIAWDMNARPNNVRVLLTASRNLGLPTNLNTGQSGLLIVQQDGTGGWNLTPNAIFKALGSFDIEKAPNAKAVFSYQVIEDYSATKVILLERLWSEGKSSLGFWKEYDLGLFVSGNPGPIVSAHGLGRQPAFALAFVQCVVAENGYAVGQRVLMSQAGEGQNASGVTVATDTTNVTVVVGINIWINRISPADSNITFLANSRWRLFLRVYE
jgi:hypothetical protein